MSGSYRKDLAKLAHELGWFIEKTRGGHLRLTHSEATGVVFTSSTLGDWRVLRNTIAQLRRALRKETTA